MSRERPPVTLAVDMVRCDGHGICAWLFPERIRLDEWGFAHLEAGAIHDKREQRRAARAARACPRRALRLDPVPTATTRPTVSS